MTTIISFARTDETKNRTNVNASSVDLDLFVFRCVCVCAFGPTWKIYSSKRCRFSDRFMFYARETQQFCVHFFVLPVPTFRCVLLNVIFLFHHFLALALIVTGIILAFVWLCSIQLLPPPSFFISVHTINCNRFSYPRRIMILDCCLSVCFKLLFIFTLWFQVSFERTKT